MKILTIKTLEKLIKIKSNIENFARFHLLISLNNIIVLYIK
jgi:hypothetical protein